MARTNRYTSLNFNEIFEKKTNPNNNNKSFTPSSSSPSPTTSSTPNSRIHGRMLVLSRPSPKPLQQTVPSPNHAHPSPQTPKSAHPDQARLELDSISLRPLGRTGNSPQLSPSAPLPAAPPPSLSIKPEPFVPPHLRPGFAGREERFVGQNGHRPKSGGQDGGRRGGGDMDHHAGEMVMDRPNSSGNHRSSGWYGSSPSTYRSPTRY